MALGAVGASGLALILPNGTTLYVALGTDCDLLTDTFTEIVDPTYARKGHSAWSTAIGATIVRSNNGAILFDALTEGVKDISWWGIFDAAVGGNLLAAGRILNGSLEPEPMTVSAGDQARFNDGQLRLIASQPAEA